MTVMYMETEENMEYSEDMFNECFQAIAFNMKKLRDRYALTQKEMSKKLNIDPQYYARLERGDDPKRKFTLEKVFLACSLFKVAPNDLITKLPDIKETVYDRSNLQKDISKKIKDMNVEQLCGLKEYMENM